MIALAQSNGGRAVEPKLIYGDLATLEQTFQLWFDRVMMMTTRRLPHRRIPEFDLVALVRLDVVDDLDLDLFADCLASEAPRVPRLECRCGFVPSGVVTALTCRASVSFVCHPY